MTDDGGIRSLNDGEDVVVDVVASLTVGKDVEGLGESELLTAVHAEVSSHEDNYAALDRPVLDIGAHVGVLDLVKRHGLDFLSDLLESGMFGSRVGHLTGVLVEVDETLTLLPVELHRLVVLI